MTLHTEEEEQTLCDLCQEKLMWQQILVDIVQGRIKVQYDDQGRPIVPGHSYPT